MLNYNIVGKGEPVLLIHGLAISFKIWRKLIPNLEKKYTLIMIELPGIGASPPYMKNDYYYFSADEIDKLRRILNVKKWSVISYSIGSRVAEIYLQKYGRYVVKTIFIFPLYISLVRTLLFNIFKTLDNIFPAMGDYILTGRRLKYLVKLLGFNGADNNEVENWFQWIANEPVEVLKQTIKMLPISPNRGILSYGVPALLVWGRKDMVTLKKSIYPNDKILNCVHGGIITHAKDISRMVQRYLN